MRIAHGLPPFQNMEGSVYQIKSQTYFTASVMLLWRLLSFDGLAIIQSLSIKKASTFQKYRDEVFIPWTNLQLSSCDRIELYGTNM